MNNRQILVLLRRIPILLIAMMFILWPFLVVGKKIVFISPRLTLLSSGEYYNFFTYYRLLLLFIISGILSILFIIEVILRKKGLKLTLLHVLFLGFGFWVLLSGLLSPYYEAFLGFYDRSGGVILYLTALIYMFMTAYFIKGKKMLITLFWAYFFCVTVVIIFSLAEFFGYSIFLNSPLKYLLGVPVDAVTNNGEKYIAVAGFYNKITLAAFLSMALSFFTVLMVETKKPILKKILFPYNLFLFFALMTTNARGGWVAYFVVLTLYLFLQWRKKNFKENPSEIFLIAIYILCCFIIYFMVVNIYNTYYQNISAERFSQTFLTYFLLLAYLLLIAGISRFFKENKRTFYLFVLLFFVFVFLLLIFSYWAPYRDNKNLMLFGSSRIYIYYQTAKIIFANLLFGTGPQMLLFEIDPNDPYRYLYLGGQFIDKAHSLYLQIAADNGLPALILFLLGVAYLLHHLWLRRQDNILIPMIFWVLAVYFLQAIFFDGLLPADLFFYTFMAVGISLISRQLKKK